MSALAQWPAWARILCVFATMVAALIGLRCYQRSTRPEPEVVRKLFHVAGGLFGLCLPWLFDSLLPVLILAVAITLLFVAMRTVPRLHLGIGQVLGAVERKSFGEFCFVISFCLLFWLADGDRLLYGVPLLVLAIADALAALVGVEYGKYRLSAWKSHKSVEGAVAFFVAAFFCVHVPVLLYTDTARLAALLIGANLALMVTMAELAAWRGLDNLLIPLFSFALLKSFLPMPARELTEHLAVLGALSLVIHFWRHRTTLADDALVGSSLFGYVVWAVSDWRWLLAPLLLIVTHRMLSAGTPMDKRRAFHFPVVIANCAAGMLWLLLYRMSGEVKFFYPFTLAFAINLTLIAIERHRYAHPDGAWIPAVLSSCLKGLCLMLPGVLSMAGVSAASLGHLALGCGVLAVSALAFARLQPNLHRYPVDTPRWVRQAFISTFASAFALLPVLTQT